MRVPFLIATALAVEVSGFTALTNVARPSAATATKAFSIQETMIRASQDDQWEEEDEMIKGFQARNFGRATDRELKNNRKSTDPTPVLATALDDFFQNTKAKKAAAAAVLMLALSPLPSNAAMSGGRIGGSISAPSRMRSMPSSSYSRGYSSGGGYTSGFASGYASGLGTGYLTAPRYSYGFSPFPSFYPRPFYGGYGGGGIISYSRGPSLGQLVFFGGMAFAISQALKRDTVDWTLPTVDDVATSALGPGNTVAKISVALEVPNRDDPGSILSVLNRLGQSSNTDSRKGIQNLTSQVALEVLRRKSSIVSASTENRHFSSRTQAMREFNSQATNERGKFERENLGLGEAGSSKATMAVVTLLISIDGDRTKIPRVSSIQDVEEALRNIATDAKTGDCLQGVEILWTPEERSETLSIKDVVADYPTLRAV